jgi:hypothetical protein
VDHAELLRSVAGQLRKIRSEAAFLTENVVDAVPSDALADAPPSHAAPSTVGA